MIERVWRGWILPDKADEYQRFLQDIFLPAAHAIPGYRGARVLRRQVGDEVEFMTITRFASIDAIRDFAGEDLERAHVAPEAQALLGRWEERVAHYDTAFDDEVTSGAALPAAAPARSDLKVRSASGGAVSVGALATGSAAFASAAFGALALGALAVGAVAVGRLSIGKARIRRLEIDELSVAKLTRPGSG
jgi:heme-degrading monooxygenase HmoA